MTGAPQATGAKTRFALVRIMLYRVSGSSEGIES
jgi:hypothetical protein